MDSMNIIVSVGCFVASTGFAQLYTNRLRLLMMPPWFSCHQFSVA